MAAGGPVAARAPLRRRPRADPGRAARRRRPLAPARAPSRRPSTSLSGVGPKLAEAAARGRASRPSATCSCASPTATATAPSSPSPSSSPAHSGTVRGRGARQRPAPLPPPRASRSPRSKSATSRARSRATWFNQPWVAPKLIPGPACCSPARGTNAGFRVSEYEFSPAAGDEEGGAEATCPAPPHPGTRGRSSSRPPGDRAAQGAADQAVGRAGDRAGAGTDRAAAGRAAGAAGLAGGRRRGHAPCTFPRGEAERRGRRERLAFEELFLYQAILATRKRTHRTARPAPRLGRPGELVGRWVESLPFEPTADQLAAFDEIDGDLDSGEPMARPQLGRQRLDQAPRPTAAPARPTA